jgi:hypothetical protein
MIGVRGATTWPASCRGCSADDNVIARLPARARDHRCFPTEKYEGTGVGDRCEWNASQRPSGDQAGVKSSWNPAKSGCADQARSHLVVHIHDMRIERQRQTAQTPAADHERERRPS